jgi:hypothetical protein
MKKLVYLAFVFLAFSPIPSFAQYQLLEKDGDRSALYFNTKLDNVDGVIFTSMFENFASPRKIKPTDTLYGNNGDLFSSERITLRLCCNDNAISIVDGQKFLEQNMQGGMVAYEKVLAENEVKWVPLDEKLFNQEPYKLMLRKCS